MAYKHGIYGSEVATSLVPMTNIGMPPVVFGTAPVHLASDAADANEPVLCYEYSEAVAAFGYSDDWDKYTLCEFMKSQFVLFNMAPVIFVNVVDKATHKTTVTDASISLTSGVGEVNAEVILDTLTVKLTEAGQALKPNIDYTAAYDKNDKVIITALEDGAAKSATSLVVSYNKLDISKVDKSDIIGGIDISSGKQEGLELVNQIFPKFGLIPGEIIAPKYSKDSEVAAVMKAKSTNINGHFKAISLCDADATTNRKYSSVSEWKNTNNFIDPYQVLCWPKVALGGSQYHLATQMAGVICKIDAAHNDIPYWSPSNQSLQADAAVLDDGTPIYLDTANAAYLNGQGIITALNFIGGWKLWGNRTTAYPSNTDVKDTMLPTRRMFNWINNTLITSFWSKVDNPANKRLIETILDSANVWLNGLTANGYILGGRVEFRSDENTITELMDGIIKFHVYVTPPSPAREIEFIQEYDPDYGKTLFN